MFRTLIVEDNAQFRRSLMQTLRNRFPFMFLNSAADGPDALAKLDRWKPNLVFVDVRLPRVNGLHLTRRIKRTSQDTTIIVLTSYDLPEYREEAARCGADYFLVKGVVDNSEIFSAIDAVLAKQCRTLVVADNAGFREQISSFLSSKWPAMIVVKVGTRAEALKMAESLKPGLVVLSVTRGDGGVHERVATNQDFGCAVVVIVGDPLDHEPCRADFCLTHASALGHEMEAIVDSLPSVPARRH